MQCNAVISYIYDIAIVCVSSFRLAGCSDTVTDQLVRVVGAFAHQLEELVLTRCDGFTAEVLFAAVERFVLCYVS
jgi:hypothetical protein